MKFKRVLSIAIAVLMALAVIPAAALAGGIIDAQAENAKLALLDAVWADLEAVENELLAAKAAKTDVVMAVYNAALNDVRVDKDSFGDLSANGFFFKVDGMCCAYDYRARNSEHRSAVDAKLLKTVSAAAERIASTKNNTGSMNVLLVGPHYSEDLSDPGYYDSSFTDQYINEINSIGAATGGQVTILGGHNATGPAIAAAYPSAGVVIYDSHGGAMNGTSYLCLTTKTGVTTTDFNNGWAYNAGSAAYIDGRYIQNHITGTLPNTIVWMAICEGMKLSGHGVTGNALLAAGAGCVYGYSQSVTFAGDYEYEATFWNEMKEGATVKDAVAYMKQVHGIPDPYGDAYPIVMSPVDPFPSNPDGAQEVNCDLKIMPDVELQSWSMNGSVEVYRGFSETVTFDRIPENANNYELEWSVADASVAEISGTKKSVVITGVALGSTTVSANVIKNGQQVGTVSCEVTVLEPPTLNEATNIEGGTLNFTSTTANYPWKVGIVGGEFVAMSGNAHVGNSTSTMQLVLNMQAGEKLKFRWLCSSEEDYDFFYFYVNNSQKAVLDGETDWQNYVFTATTAGTYTFQWRFVKDPYMDGVTDAGYVDDVEYVRNYVPGMGDVDLNGSVDGADALLALRYAMGIMTDLTAEQLAQGDVNGDGAVDGTDALMILRMSMGIN
jgi:hypothetical protein